MSLSPEWITPLPAVVTAVCALGWALSLRDKNQASAKRADGLRDRLAARPSDDVHALRDEIEALKTRMAADLTHHRRMVAKGNELVEAYWAMERELQAKTAEAARLAGAHRSMAETTSVAKTRTLAFGMRVAELQKHLNDVRAQDGRVWQRPVAATAPAFRPREERGFPIISVLNLKGGVGKTTVTAHLAATLGRRGKRVLMIDLDYQRSLSMMLLSHDKRRALRGEGRCFQHFLGGPAHDSAALIECAAPVTDMHNCAVVTNSDARSGADSLEETEARLMAEWMVRPAGPDIRFFLRDALHDEGMVGKSDCVLLDCPPRLTTASVNALAASDYVLVPVVLDALSTRALPELLRFLGRLRDDLLPNLQVLGVVANLTKFYKGALVEQEQAVWDKMQEGLEHVWAGRVPFLKTKIPDKALFGKAAGSIDEGRLKLATEDEAVLNTFSELVAELETEFSRDDRVHAATVPA